MDRIDRRRIPSGWLWIGAAAVLLAAAALAVRGRRQPQLSRLPAPRRRAPPDWYSEAAPGPDGRLTPDRLVDIAAQDSFPASDPPGYSMPRTGHLLR